MFISFVLKSLEETGLLSLWSSPLDTKLLCAQRFVRLYAYGSSTLILVSYLSVLGISKEKIGLFMTLTLIGATVLSFVLTIFADVLGRRTVMAMGAGLMAVSGVVFAICGNYWMLLAAAVVGVISPSGNEIGPFRAIEESTIAQLTPTKNRGDIYAWYSLSGAAGSALGMGTCGWTLDFLLGRLGWNTMRAYRVVFWAYSALAVVMLGIVLSLSKACELEVSEDRSDDSSDEEEKPPKTASILSKLPHFNRKTKIVVLKLCALFGLDSFATSLAPVSWVSFFFQEKFTLGESKLGTIFFITGLVAAISMLPASAIAKRFGNIRTMILAHLPSAIFLSVMPIPSSVTAAVTLLVLRSCTQSMDTAPRSAFLAGIVTSHERTPVMGCILVAKTSAASLGPIVTGTLAGKSLLWVAFVLAGSLMIVYDAGILVVFGGRDCEVDHEWSGDEEAEIHSSHENLAVRVAEVEERKVADIETQKSTESDRDSELLPQNSMEKSNSISANVQSSLQIPPIAKLVG